MYFPVFIDLSKKQVLVVGAGKIASRRVRTLSSFTGNITVVAPQISQEIRELAVQYPMTLDERSFLPEDLEQKDMVLAATDDDTLNRRIASLCKEKRIPVNVCSDQTLCDFQFPSVVRDGDVVIGINASGKDHHLVKKTRQKVEQSICGERFRSNYID